MIVQMTVDSVYNASAEVAAAANYPNVRLFTVGQSTVSDKVIHFNQILKSGLKSMFF